MHAAFDDELDEGPGEHDAHLMDDDPGETVPCARCGKPVWTYAQRCQHCGVHFAGEAWQFKPAGEAIRHPRRLLLWLIIGLCVLAMLMIVVFGF